MRDARDSRRDAVTDTAREGRAGWLRFKGLEPGHRFQTRYARAQGRRETGEAPAWLRPLNVFGGVLLVVAGFVFLPTPGPSYIIIVLGLWMLAGQWLPLARLFDRLEVRLRGLGRRLKDRWRGSSAAAKALGVLAAPACVAALGYALFA